MVNIELTLNEISTSYGKNTILHWLTAQPLTEGKVVGLLGPNACGKSTLLKSIAGVVPVDSGEATLTIDGKPIIKARERQRLIGYVPQDLPSSAALTAYETVLVSAIRTHGKRRAERVAAQIMYELGIDHLVFRYLTELSGGQRQMVAFAQMLVSNPSVMLLDEPTSALDLNKQLFLLSQVQQRVKAQNSLALIAIHDINLSARFCDELLVMKAGELVAQGAPEHILTPELIHKVFDVEAKVLDHEGVPVIAAVA